MKENESERIIKDTIEYANNEIKKNKKKNLFILFGIVCLLFLVIAVYGLVFNFETSVAYFDDIVNVEIPEDKGIDIKINLPNYKNSNAILVKIDEENYDLYINITQTLATKIFKDDDTSNNMMRVGNGMIVDFQSEHFLGYIPNGKNHTVIKNIYYIKDYNKEIATSSDEELFKINDKQLIWTNKD